jgi:hypothetical protein
MTLEYIPKLPSHPRTALFARSISRDLKAIAEALDGNSATIRLVSEQLYGLPRAVDLDAIGRILKSLGDVNVEVEREQRKLREILTELLAC